MKKVVKEQKKNGGKERKKVVMTFILSTRENCGLFTKVSLPMHHDRAKQDIYKIHIKFN